MAQSRETVMLPEPVYADDKSVEGLLWQRRSVRDYQDATLQLSDISQLLWAAQGITHAAGLRTAPSAGALYPLELYVVAGNVNDLAAGVYHYQAEGHRLARMHGGDQRKPLAQAALAQNWVSDAAAVVVFAAMYERTKRKYGQRGIRYVHMEVGHAAQNLFLQAEALGLATVVVGAFRDDEVAGVLQLPADVRPLALMPIGRSQ
ncbi:MAG: SagB/ThcOx family dehydrogenase [Gammaproteobacteria bacterium]|nr:SagB/ThcOx family dehydrogenase [Gammaproteobacteria bacterium]